MASVEYVSVSPFENALAKVFNRASEVSGVGSGYFRRLSLIESNNDPWARNDNSSAGGLFQFLNGTWSDWGSGSKFGTGLNVGDAIGGFTKNNANFLSKILGRNPTEGELYLAHQQGASGAAKLLKNPNARAADIVGYDAVVDNGGTYDMTAGDFAKMWTSKFTGGEVSGSVTGETTDNSGTWIGTIENWFTRIAVIVLGFVFIAVGLAMFKPQLLPTPVQKILK